MTPYYQDDEVTLYHGDCLDVIAKLPDNSVDAVVTDPPYGLEFMGKDWDAPWKESDVNADAGFHGGGISATRKLPSFTGTTNPKCLRCKGTRRGRRDGTAKVAVCLCRDGGQFPNVRAVEMRAFQQWSQEWAAECLRVLKPGGHMLAFGGTRTWHRLASAIEDAGFEIRDSIAWLYGCLTADTEVLTDSGWKLGIDVTEGDLVAQWDSETDQITLAPVQQVFRAPWDGPMRILRNADTDQVLTPNHRVYHRPAQRKMVSGKRRRWFDNQWQVAEAADLSTWNPVQLPVAGHHEGSGIGGDDYAALLGWVWTEGGFDPSGTGVRIYQSSVNADKVAEIAALMDRIGAHKRYDRERTYRGRVYTETMWFISGELAERVRADLPGKRPTYDLLWRMTGSEKLALLRAAMLGDGSGWGTRSQQFHQKYEDDLVWLQTLLALIGRSGKVGMRPDRQCGALYLRDRATTELQARHLRDDTEHYTGEVWCVKVPTGAFVARRNGKVFITGNSGFPKSMDVSKAIDKAAGAEREVIGTKGNKGRRAAEGWGMRQDADGDPVTAPATDAAKQWQGWGTALKPSYEPVCVAVKPYGVTDILDAIGSHITRLEDECRPPANGAARSSAPTPADSQEVRADTAPESAATPHEGEQARTTPTGAAAGSSAATDTSAFELEGETCWSTVTSWRACWDELYDLTSTSTTSTASSLTTDLRTLWSSIASLTVTSTPDSPTPRLTSSSTASAVDSLFAATVLRSRATLALSAPESATASTQPSPQGAGGRNTAFEPIVVARKPLAGTVAANVLEHGTGALNIDACRIAATDKLTAGRRTRNAPIPGDDRTETGKGAMYAPGHQFYYVPNDAGRWPTNVVLDDAQAAELDAQTGVSVSRKGKPRAGANGNGWGMTATGTEYDDEGGASRFFPVFRYEAKAPGAERPSVVTTKLRLRADLTPEQVDHVVARLREAGVEID
ncbi:DNA methylase [Mycobacterium phage ShiLan]|uniref:DNA methylase n=1 Tax=Mycobacterium phage ShiLan TaxID=1036616 RepID=G1DUQ9_9CAUD|nr:DNA methyltransferase [Mycobacterium phage ShiLan]AEJ93250.1 DNA methylase [Mycobacterium phage ShiLan]